MQIGIGIPATIPGTERKLLLEWIRRADQGPFSSLGIIDRLVYSNYEALAMLAAAAALTERVRLTTTILISPLHNTAILAKQAASIDALSQGRLTLGLAVGGREDDYKAAQVPFKQRGKLFDEQLATMKQIWSGQPLSADIDAIGPTPVRPGGPEILIGGNTPAAIQRVGRFGDGFIVGGGGAKMAAQSYQIAETSWKEAGRPGKPRFVAGQYFALGTDAAEKGREYIRHYYSFLPAIADAVAQSIPTTPEAVKESIQSFADIGLDELILWPTVADLAQLERAAEIASAIS